jgi:hypothetical protein
MEVGLEINIENTKYILLSHSWNEVKTGT